MTERVKILIADDHPLIRAGAVQSLSKVESYTVVGEAGDGAEALELIRTMRPDIAVLDIQMPKMNGLEVLAALAEEEIQTRVLLLTMYKNRNYFYQAVLSGAKGYVLKQSALEELHKAVDTVYRGGTFLSESLASLIESADRPDEDTKWLIEAIATLTPAERKVLKKIAGWKTNREIAGELFVSPRTVGSHRNHICEKLDLHGAHSLIRFAIENRELL